MSQKKKRVIEMIPNGLVSCAGNADAGRKQTESQSKSQSQKVTKASKSSRHGKNNSRLSRGDKTAIKSAMMGSPPGSTLRFGCFFSKHDPPRYVGVYGRACTHPPGLEKKHLIEHCRRVHSCLTETKCRCCGTPWQMQDDADARFTEFEQHMTLCPGTQAQKLAQPEVMTRQQEQELTAWENDVRMTEPELYWIAIFKRLFPECFPIPSPFYDYFIPRHETTLHMGPRVSQHDEAFGVFTRDLGFSGRAVHQGGSSMARNAGPSQSHLHNPAFGNVTNHQANERLAAQQSYQQAHPASFDMSSDGMGGFEVDIWNFNSELPQSGMSHLQGVSSFDTPMNFASTALTDGASTFGEMYNNIDDSTPLDPLTAGFETFVNTDTQNTGEVGGSWTGSWQYPVAPEGKNEGPERRQ